MDTNEHPSPSARDLVLELVSLADAADALADKVLCLPCGGWAVVAAADLERRFTEAEDALVASEA